MGRAVSINVAVSQDGDWDGLNVKSVVQMGGGGMSAMITGVS